MELILRPLIPPRSLTDCTYASTPGPTSPIEDGGPLKGNTPPILISVAVTPGASAANAVEPSAKIKAQPIFNFSNILAPPSNSVTVSSFARTCLQPRQRNALLVFRSPAASTFPLT